MANEEQYPNTLLYGTPYGSYTTHISNVDRMFIHCCPDVATVNDIKRNKRPFVYSAKFLSGSANVPAWFRNEYVSQSARAAPPVSVDEFIYWDVVQNKPMTYSPVFTTVPVEFTYT